METMNTPTHKPCWNCGGSRVRCCEYAADAPTERRLTPVADRAKRDETARASLLALHGTRR